MNTTSENSKQDIEFNINEYCTVVLSQHGAAIVNEYNNWSNLQFQKVGISFSSKTDYKEGDTFKNQFWYMMQLFGEGCSLGLESPFKYGMIVLHKTF